MEIIKDGRGTGNLLRVEDEGRALTRATIESREHHHNRIHASAFNIILNITPSASDCPIVYIKNNESKDLVLEEIMIRCEIDNVIYLRSRNTGTLINGTNVTPANLNLRSNLSFDATIKTCEKLETIAEGTELMRYYIAASNQSQVFNFSEDIIIPQAGIFTIWSKNANGEVNINLPVYWNFDCN